MDRKERSIADYVIIVLSPVILIAVWQIATDKGLVNGAIVPSPGRVIEAFRSLIASGKYFEHFNASLIRVSIGFIIGTCMGVLLGILTGLFKKVDDLVTVIFSVFRSIPNVGLVPLFILWCGIGEESKIIVIALGTFWSVLLNTQRGISGTDFKLLEVARILQKDKLTVLLKIIIPAALPSIFTGVRLGLSGAWRSVVAAEMIASMRGIGYMIQYAREMSQPAVMFVGLLTLGLVGLALDLVVKLIEKKLIYWD